MAHGVSLAVSCKKVGAGLRVRLQGAGAFPFAGQQGVQSRAQGKTLFSQRDGRLHQPRPGQTPVQTVGQLQHGHDAGHTHRAATGHGGLALHGLALGGDEELFSGACWRSFAAVKGLHLRAAGMQQKRAATDATALWLDQREHHLHGHGSVHRRAAFVQYLRPGSCGQGVGGGHGMALEGPTGFGVETRRSLGQLHARWLRHGGHAGHQQKHHAGNMNGPEKPQHASS